MANTDVVEGELVDRRTLLLEDIDRNVRGALMSFAVKLTWGDRQWAEDVVQETLVRAWRHADELPLDAEKARPWLFTVARRIVVDDLRAQAARPPLVPATWLESSADTKQSVERVVAEEHMRGALRTLSPMHRDVLFEIYYQDRSMAEAAEVLGIPTGTVKSRAHYAIRVLREVLEDGSAAAQPAKTDRVSDPRRAPSRPPRRAPSPRRTK